MESKSKGANLLKEIDFSKSKGANLLKEIDFSTLTAEGIWSIFVSKSCYGGALAYAVLSRANKMGCLSSSSLEKLPANRMKQRECWYDWCSLTCNLFWARRVSFQLVSQRASYKKRVFATWSEPEALPLPELSCSAFTLPANSVARIASLAVHGDSAKLLDQIECCANDDRRIIMPELWLKIKNDFVCNSSWEPVFEFTFSEVRHIRPAVHPDHISPGTIADTWLRILYHLRNVFMSPSLLQPTPPENHTVWVHCICSPSLEIPMSERAVIMWIWLLWSSTETPIPFFLVSKLRPAPVPSLDVPKAHDTHTLKHRLSVLTSLRSEGLITNAEFKTKRQCIIGSL
jgi:hypothetical protein